VRNSYLSGRQRWLSQVDKAAADLNVITLVFAIRLATLRVTILFAQHVIDRLPAIYVVQMD
jgi:hypothetical protein